MTKLTGETADLAQENMAQLKVLFPDVFVEGKVDFAKLRQVLGEYVADSKEHYSFTWNGKGQALKLAQMPTTGTLRPCREESKNWDSTKNVYIEGDNLEVLKLLHKSYFNKIKMIYIDPPYNTGKDFVYKDDFRDNIDNYKKITGQVDSEGNSVSTNSESSGRYHTDWLNMMYPRLRLARDLLSEDGVIFISIDDHEVANLRKICDEIFGEDNFVAIISWRRTDNQPNIGNFAKVKEYILCYSKNKQEVKLEKLPLSDKAKKEYSYKDENGFFRRAILLDKTRGRKFYPVKTKSGNILNGPWMISESEFQELEKNSAIYWTQGGEEQPYGKIYLSNSNGQIPNDFWGIEFGTNQRGSLEVETLFEKRFFDFPKPCSLIKSLLSVGTNNKSIILDFFSGSATTAHAVMQLNAEDGGKCQYIMVQLPEQTDEKSEAYKAGYKNICEIGKERIRRAGEKIKAEKGLLAEDLDIGFKIFKLDSSNIIKWQPREEKQTLEELKQQLMAMGQVIVTGRSELDVVYEIMLKLGFALTSSIEELIFAGKKVYSVSAGALFVCLADCVTLKVAEEILSYIYIYKSKGGQNDNSKDCRIVFSDAGFPDDSTKISIKERFKQAGFEDAAFMTI